MKYVLNPPLEHVALVKVVVTLWNLNDVRDIMKKYSLSLHHITKIKEWQKIEDRVMEKVPQLPLPGLLKKKLLNFIKPIGFQILKWIRYHCKGSYLDLDLPNELCWTPQGTIDRKKTAEILVQEENLDISKCYKLACTYCLEVYIKELWNKIPYNLIDSIICDNSLGENSQQDLIFYWSYIMEERENNTFFYYKSKFESCAEAGNKVAAEYFLQKLTLTLKEREKCIIKKSIIRIAKRVADAEVLCFLLSQMDEEQEIEIFKYRPYDVLKCFLKWPLQCFCMEVANRIWDFLFIADYYYLLFKIIDKVVKNWKDWNYQKFFGEVWQKSPKSMKDFIICKFTNGYLLSDVFQIKDKENFKLILQDATLIQKERLIYCYSAQDFCQNLIIDDEWDLLGTFIRECLPSEDEMIKFKEEFEECVTLKFFKDHLSRNNHKWVQVFSLSNDFIYKCDKRNLEQGESSSSKRLRSIE